MVLPDRSRDSFDEVAYNAALQEFRAAMDGDDASALLNAYDKLERLFAALSSDRALAALDLFAESRSDYAAAVGTYLRLSELAPETTYCQALREAGLPNYLEKGQVTAFSIRLANALGV